MRQFYSCILLCIFPLFHLSAQVFPKENSTLNYRLVGFSLPFENEDGKYKIEIAAGHYDSRDSFKKNIIRVSYSDKNRVIIEVPSFATQYTWRAVYIANDSTKIKSVLYHFSTGFVPEVDTNINRLRIIAQAKKYKDAFVFVDGTGILYDMNGRPIWYLPDIPGKADNQGDYTGPLDLKLSPFGTITTILGPEIYELDYNGNVLWKMPGHTLTHIDTANKHGKYHHEFTHLANGHYMALASEELMCKLPAANDSSFLIITDNKIKKDNNYTYQKFPFGTLIEYDDKGNVVWSWETAKYIAKSDLKYIGLSGYQIDPHDNAFYFDEQNKVIYMSFRNISRIIKIKYPEGNVLDSYGPVFHKGMHYQGDLRDFAANNDQPFCGQHACKCSQNGYLYMFDNAAKNDSIPKVVMMQLIGKGDYKKIWEYECPIYHNNFLGPRAGGNVMELAGNSIFVSMGSPSSNIFIVDLNKETIWSAISEKWNPALKIWDMKYHYRASIITSRKDIEQLIWNSEKNLETSPEL